VKLAASFPEIPLPAEPVELATPTLPALELRALRDLVVSRSHEIRAAEREAERQEVLARRAKADRIPDPSFGIRLFSERGGAETGAGLVASIPLGGAYRRSADEEAAASANAARFELAAVQREIQGVADADMSNALTRLNAWRSAEAAVHSTAEAAARTARGYDAGQVDLADLLFARRQTMDARRAEIDARSEAARALLKIQIDSHTIWAPDHEHEE
jgi:outer membrane protein TolC